MAGKRRIRELKELLVPLKVREGLDLGVEIEVLHSHPPSKQAGGHQN
jgi:hypothetical protein